MRIRLSFADVLSLFALVCMISILVYSLPRGLDLTDESYYLVSARYPEFIVLGVTNFFIYTKYLFSWANNDVITFRLFGALILLVVALFYSRAFTSLLSRIYEEDNSSPALVFLLVVSTLLFYFWRWYPAPSYNWLNLLACLIVSIGFFYAIDGSSDKKSILSGFLIGLAGFLAFVSKPTTAALLAVMASVFFLFKVRKQSWKLPLYAILSCVFFLSYHVAIEFHGADAYIQFMGQGFEQLSTIDNRHGLLTVTTRLTGFWLHCIGIGLLVAILVCLIFSADFRADKLFSLKMLWERVSFVLGFVLTIAWLHMLSDENGDTQTLSRVVIVSSISFFLLGSLRRISTSELSYKKVYRKTAMLFLLNYGIAFSLVFGTDVTPIKATTAGLVFLVANLLLGLRLIAFSKGAQFVPIWALIYILPFQVWSVAEEVFYPYRLAAPLFEQQEYLPIEGGGVYVDRDSYVYFKQLREATGNTSFRNNNRVLIDLTGHSPGVSFVLGSRPVARAWLLGGREGSDLVIENAISKAGEITEQIWVLEAPQGDRALGRQVLTNNNIIFPANFDLVGEFVHPCRTRKDSGRECIPEVQYLWKQKHSNHFKKL